MIQFNTKSVFITHFEVDFIQLDSSEIPRIKLISARVGNLAVSNLRLETKSSQSQVTSYV